MRRDPHNHIPTPIRAQPTLDRFATLTATKVILRDRKTRKALHRPDVDVDLDSGDCGFIATRIAHHLDIARNHPSEPDGYPTKASGADTASGGGAGPDDVDLTSVEAAVEARARWSDEHDALTERAWGYVQDAVHALAAAHQLLTKLDGLGTPPEGLGLADERWCENHLRHGYPTEPRASDGSRNCRWCADINRALGSYPNLDLIAHRHRYGKLTYAAIRQQFPDYKPETRMSA